MHQILRRQRHATAAEVFGRGAQLAAHRSEAARHQMLRRFPGDPDRDVVAFFRQVHQSVGNRHVEGEVGTEHEKFRQGRCDV